MKENLACSTKYILRLRSSPKFAFSVLLESLDLLDEERRDLKNEKGLSLKIQVTAGGAA